MLRTFRGRGATGGVKAGMCAAVIAVAAASAAATAAAEAERWFGLSEGDFGNADSFAGKPLKVKARFVRIMKPLEQGIRMHRLPARGKIVFLVEAAAGEMVCRMENCGLPAKRLRAMKRATPVVLHGTLDPRTRVFLVREVQQGWGRRQLGRDAAR